MFTLTTAYTVSVTKLDDGKINHFQYVGYFAGVGIFFLRIAYLQHIAFLSKLYAYSLSGEHAHMRPAYRLGLL